LTLSGQRNLATQIGVPECHFSLKNADSHRFLRLVISKFRRHFFNTWGP
jgi:hypothetical protein